MAEYKCAFSSTMMKNQFGCECAMQVTRRSGPDIACANELSSNRCQHLYEQLKQIALPAFGVEDDLLSMPHSVMVKVQFGGLLGIQRLVAARATDIERVENINQLVEHAINQFGSLNNIPYNKTVDLITSYKIKRRVKQ